MGAHYPNLSNKTVPNVFTPPTLFPEKENYTAFLRGLKDRIRQAQVKAAIAVNQELMLLYWHIGRDILEH